VTVRALKRREAAHIKWLEEVRRVRATFKLSHSLRQNSAALPLLTRTSIIGAAATTVPNAISRGKPRIRLLQDEDHGNANMRKQELFGIFYEVRRPVKVGQVQTTPLPLLPIGRNCKM
jgi:ApbE superfamily uncharacterized protein (UPF0280 family)